MHMKSLKGFTHQRECVNKDEGRAQKMKGSGRSHPLARSVLMWMKQQRGRGGGVKYFKLG